MDAAAEDNWTEANSKGNSIEQLLLYCVTVRNQTDGTCSVD